MANTLIEFKTFRMMRNGESFIRATLKFEMVSFLGMFKKNKTITYDVSMYEDIKCHKTYWNDAIKAKSNFPKSIIKDRRLF